jgi:hypothetical protein
MAACMMLAPALAVLAATGREATRPLERSRTSVVITQARTGALA